MSAAKSYSAVAMKALTLAEKAAFDSRISAMAAASSGTFKAHMDSAKEAVSFRYNKEGHAKVEISDLPTPTRDEIAACHKLLLEIASSQLLGDVPKILADESRSKDSSVVAIDCATIIKTLAELDLNGRPVGYFWARWLVFHIFMGYTPGFTLQDVATFSASAAEHAKVLKESVSLPSLGSVNAVSIMKPLKEMLDDFMTTNFEEDTCRELNVGIHLEGEAVSGKGDFYSRNLRLIMTTGAATDAYARKQKDAKRKSYQAHFSKHKGAAAGAGGRGQ